MDKKVLYFTLILALISFASVSGSLANTNQTIPQKKDPLEKETIIKVQMDVSSEVEDGQETKGDCTVSGSVTITDESGNSVTVEFTITADTCAEAMRAAKSVISAVQK
jgi:hypothetical protein